jgi:hypothetical protein
MGMSNFFGWGSSEVAKQELPDIFPLAFKRDDFIWIDVMHIYAKILTDVIERTHGISEKIEPLLWDNCIKSESCDGLISLLAKAMTHKRKLFLVYEKALDLLREATNAEATKIEADYKTQGKSSVGVFISFEQYRKSDLVKLYSALEYCTIASLNKSLGLSSAIQLKMNDLRASVSLADSADVKTQGASIAASLAAGKDVMIDGKDVIETAVPDLTAIKESIEYLNEKRSFYLGLPESYITGEQTGGLGSTGENDTKAIERGLKSYYVSIIKPVMELLFGAKTTYKSQDFTQVTSAVETLKTFSITDDELISKENKTLIINRLFDLPEDSEGDPPPKVDPNAPKLDANGKPVAPAIPQKGNA